MEWVFTQTDNGAGDLKVPYFEDSRANVAPYYSTTTKLETAKRHVLDELSKLGAGVPMLQEGYFQVGKDKRYGYIITFQYGGGRGVVRVAGLPIKHGITDSKIEKVRKQALLIVRDWLKAAVTAKIFNPGSDPLVPYMLVDGNRTVADHIHTLQRLPELPAPEVIEGESVGHGA